MLSLINQDHKQVEQLLNVLTQQLAQIESEQHGVDFSLMGDIVHYLRNYIDKYHHPKEDLIYAYYLDNYVSDVDMPNRLATEHQSLNLLCRDLCHSLNIIQLDSVMPFDELATQLRHFIEKQRAHIIFEESAVLPVIVKCFTPDDWCHINHLWSNGNLQDCETNALFLAAYKSLYARIMDAGFCDDIVAEIALI